MARFATRPPAKVANAAAGGDGSRRGATAGEQGAERAVVGSVLQHVQALRGEVEAESLFELLRTLHALPANAGGWLDSFLELDGMQALLDVLSLSQTATARTDDTVQQPSEIVSTQPQKLKTQRFGGAST